MTNNGRIAEAVATAVADGTLTEGFPMNPPGADYRSGDVFIGRNTYGQRVWLSVRLSHHNATRYYPLPEQPQRGWWTQTVDHETIGERWTLAISGGAVDARRKGPGKGGDWSESGQIIDTFRRVYGVKGVAAVAEIWAAHHLNGMRPGCIHVPTPVMERPGPGTYERPDLANTPACPVTGYRYGTQWLHSDLPADAVITLLSFLASAKNRAS